MDLWGGPGIYPKHYNFHWITHPHTEGVAPPLGKKYSTFIESFLPFLLIELISHLFSAGGLDDVKYSGVLKGKDPKQNICKERLPETLVHPST